MTPDHQQKEKGRKQSTAYKRQEKERRGTLEHYLREQEREKRRGKRTRVRRQQSSKHTLTHSGAAQATIDQDHD